MVRKLFTSLFFILIIGCQSELRVNISPLNELNPNGQEIFEPATPPEFNHEEESLDLLCNCYWQVWHENGLTCAGIRCSENCSSEMRACNERKACMIEGI